MTWIRAALALTAVATGMTLWVYTAAGGREIADDAPALLGLVRSPAVLLGNYAAAGISSTWGSFPPLFPLLFGLLVRPWTFLVSDFWAIRLGVWTWTLVVLLLLDRALVRVSAPPAARQAVLWAFALLPSVWGAIALIPQEEIYVAAFVLLLLDAALKDRWGWVSVLFVITALAAKYFLLILIIPLAILSRAPLSNLARFGVPCACVLTSYVAYHWVADGLQPILGHRIDSAAAISVWGLLWNLGLRPDPDILRPVAVGMCGLAVLLFSVAARRVAIPLPHTMAISLFITLLLLPSTFPAYVLWAVPLTLLCAAGAPARTRGALIGLMSVWGLAEWGANFARGVSQDPVGIKEGKAALIETAQGILGSDFPFHVAHLACLVGVLLSGLGLIGLLTLQGIGRGPRATEPLRRR